MVEDTKAAPSIVEQIDDEADDKDDKIRKLESAVELLDERVGELEERMDIVETEQEEGRYVVETKISETNKRLHAVEKKLSNANLKVNADLSEMERYLTEKKDLSPADMPKTKLRAVVLAKNWKEASEYNGMYGNAKTYVANIRKGDVTAVLEKHLSKYEGDVSLSNKQMHRVFETVVDMFEREDDDYHTRVYQRLNDKSNARELVIENPYDRSDDNDSRIIWTPDELDEELEVATLEEFDD